LLLTSTVNKGLIIIPTFNEAENIILLIENILRLPERFDILIVDDGSPDNTAELVSAFAEKNGFNRADAPNRIFLESREGKQGLGTAYIHGFKYALERGYEFIFEMDADFSHNPSDLVGLFNACSAENYDIAIGSRYISGVNVVNWPMGRVLLSYFASAYVKFITGMPINDATAGFKCYRRQVLETIDLDNIKFVGYAFQIEMKFTAWKHGFKIKEVPIIFTERKRGESKMSANIIKEAVLGVISMKIGSFFRRYQPFSQT
jgi:dolichol-phosphate mannosyltransferase